MSPEPAVNIARLTDMVTMLVKGLVDMEDDVSVSAATVKSLLLYEVRVAQPDFGKLIGRQGANARALRTLVRAMGRKHGLNAYVEVVDPQGNAYRISDPEDGAETRPYVPKPTR